MIITLIQAKVETRKANKFILFFKQLCLLNLEEISKNTVVKFLLSLTKLQRILIYLFLFLYLWI